MARHDIPTIFLHFGRMVTDPGYLWGKLAPTFATAGCPGVSRAAFDAAWREASANQRRPAGTK